MEALKENLDSGEAESETASEALQSSTTFAEGTESHSSHENIPTARQTAPQLRSPTGTSSKLTCTMCWALRIRCDPQFQMPVAALAGFKSDSSFRIGAAGAKYGSKMDSTQATRLPDGTTLYSKSPPSCQFLYISRTPDPEALNNRATQLGDS